MRFTVFRTKNNAARAFFTVFSIYILFGLLAFQSCYSSMPGASASGNSILYHEDFEDGDITKSDPGIENGMTWTTHGVIEIGTSKSYDSSMVKMNTGAYILSGSAITAYIDGVECSRIECTGKIRRDASRDIVIGRNPWGDSFEGLLDEIRIYDRALSEGEIKQLIETK
ncbi:MAG: LamG domain-containing protein [Clostridiaceae bacterium]|nr:LamG domain-containing protein [Clostridiaceae bacterium]